MEKKRKKAIGLLGSFLLIVFILAGCGNSGNEESNGGSGNGMASAGKAASKQEKKSGLPYAEENNLAFGIKTSFTAPATAYFIGRGGEENVDLTEQGLSISCSDASYEIREVTEEENGEEQVTLRLVYNVITMNTITLDTGYGSDGGDIRSGTGWETIGLFDYYTGKIFPAVDSFAWDSGASKIDLPYQEHKWTLSYTMGSESTSEREDWVQKEENIWESIGVSACTYTYTVTMPKDYDGLCLYLNLDGRPDYEESEELGWEEPKTVLEEFKEGQEQENYLFIQVKDLLAMEGSK